MSDRDAGTWKQLTRYKQVKVSSGCHEMDVFWQTAHKTHVMLLHGVGDRVSEDVTERLCLVTPMAQISLYEKILVVTDEQKILILLGP